jgi:hypothetical protein
MVAELRMQVQLGPEIDPLAWFAELACIDHGN